jgi:hypothetical protein
VCRKALGVASGYGIQRLYIKRMQFKSASLSTLMNKVNRIIVYNKLNLHMIYM